MLHFLAESQVGCIGVRAQGAAAELAVSSLALPTVPSPTGFSVGVLLLAASRKENQVWVPKARLSLQCLNLEQACFDWYTKQQQNPTPLFISKTIMKVKELAGAAAGTHAWARDSRARPGRWGLACVFSHPLDFVFLMWIHADLQTIAHAVIYTHFFIHISLSFSKKKFFFLNSLDLRFHGNIFCLKFALPHIFIHLHQPPEKCFHWQSWFASDFQPPYFNFPTLTLCDSCTLPIFLSYHHQLPVSPSCCHGRKGPKDRSSQFHHLTSNSTKN